MAAAAAAVRRRVSYEWSAGGLRTGRLDRLRAPNLIATPRDFRPTRAERGRAILAGRMELAGATLDMGEGGDPWDRPSPTRRFAVDLHRFAWLPDLLASGEAGSREALRLFLDWRRMFYRANRFVWSEPVAERRLYNLACGAKRMAAVASDAEAAVLFNALLHHARYLSRLDEGPASAARRACVPALAVAALHGRVADKLTARWTARLSKLLPETVLPDGGLKSRSPEAALELLFDLLTLDDVLLQRGRDTPVAVTRAIDRLGSALRFFTLADGRLACFHGGEMQDADHIRAATSQEAEEEDQPFGHAPHSGYHRLSGPTLQAILDAAPPAAGPWSVAACAQPLAIEVVCGRDRIFSNSGWSPHAAGPQGLRLTAGGCTAQLGGRSAGRPLTGLLARALGPRLVEGPRQVKARRDENEAGAWLELSHDGWVRRFGLMHERRVYTAAAVDELRGEDVFSPAKGGRGRRTDFAVRFHVDADVQVSMARDGRSVLLRGASSRGWWFRNDAAEVALEPSVQFQNGLPRRTVQVVLRGEAPASGTARVRWKLTAVEPAPPKAAGSRAKPGKREPGPLEATPPTDLPMDEDLVLDRGSSIDDILEPAPRQPAVQPLGPEEPDDNPDNPDAAAAADLEHDPAELSDG